MALLCFYLAGLPGSLLPLVFDAIARGELQVDQILIELHSRTYEDISRFFQNADDAKFRIFHKERNAWGCNGFGCIEYAFVSESYLRNITASFVC